MATNIVSVDEDIQSADWTKHTWDLPPYRSTAFLTLFPDLDLFKTLPVYAAAVSNGLIHDDEWLADSVSGWEGL